MGPDQVNRVPCVRSDDGVVYRAIALARRIVGSANHYQHRPSTVIPAHAGIHFSYPKSVKFQGTGPDQVNMVPCVRRDDDVVVSRLKLPRSNAM